LTSNLEQLVRINQEELTLARSEGTADRIGQLESVERMLITMAGQIDAVRGEAGEEDGTGCDYGDLILESCDPAGVWREICSAEEMKEALLDIPRILPHPALSRLTNGRRTSPSPFSIRAVETIRHHTTPPSFTNEMGDFADKN